MPLYPAITEMVRPTGPTIGNNIYPAQIDQFALPLSLRDRVACYLWEPNGIAVAAGKYKARLLGAYNNLPLYGVGLACCTARSFSSSSRSVSSSSQSVIQCVFCPACSQQVSGAWDISVSDGTRGRVFWTGPLPPPVPQWPSYTGTSQYVGTSCSGKVNVWYDPSLGAPALKNAQDLVADADRSVIYDNATFASAGGIVNVIVFALNGVTDGTGGAEHGGCDFTTGQNIEVDASFGQSARVSGLFQAELSECYMAGRLCGKSTGEALSRWAAAITSNNALSDYASGGTWASAGYPNWVDNTENTDQNAVSIGCGVAFISWLLHLGKTFPQIAQAMVNLGDSATLANLYAILGLGTAGNAWTNFKLAINGISGGVTNDDPFNSRPAAPTANSQCCTWSGTDQNGQPLTLSYTTVNGWTVTAAGVTYSFSSWDCCSTNTVTAQSKTVQASPVYSCCQSSSGLPSPSPTSPISSIQSLLSSPSALSSLLSGSPGSPQPSSPGPSSQAPSSVTSPTSVKSSASVTCPLVIPFWAVPFNCVGVNVFLPNQSLPPQNSNSPKVIQTAPGAQTNSTSATTGAFPSKLTAGNAVIAMAWSLGGSAPNVTFSDSDGRNYTTYIQTALTGGVTRWCAIGVAFGITGGTAPTVTVNSGLGVNETLAVVAIEAMVSGVSVLPVGNGGLVGTPAQPGNMTTANVNDLVVAVCSGSNLLPNGFTEAFNGTGPSGEGAYKIETAIATENPNFGTPGVFNWVAMQMAFKSLGQTSSASGQTICACGCVGGTYLQWEVDITGFDCIPDQKAFLIWQFGCTWATVVLIGGGNLVLIWNGTQWILYLNATTPCCKLGTITIVPIAGTFVNCLSSSSSKAASAASSSPSGIGCSYTFKASLDWSQGARSDLDLYVKNVTDNAVCYFGNDPAGGLTLDHDAYPVCGPSAPPPEVTAGNFTGNKTFKVWYNQYSNCSAEEQPLSRTVTITNTGGTPISVNGTNVPPGQSITLPFTAYAGYATGDQAAFAGGDTFTILCASGSAAPSSSSLAPSSQAPSSGAPSAASSSSPSQCQFWCVQDLLGNIVCYNGAKVTAAIQAACVPPGSMNIGDLVGCDNTGTLLCTDSIPAANIISGPYFSALECADHCRTNTSSPSAGVASCCPGGFPATLHATITVITGSCDCLNITVPLIFSAPLNGWKGDVTVTCLSGNCRVQLFFQCPAPTGTQPTLQVTLGVISPSSPATSFSCGPPMEANFNNVSAGGCCLGATINIRITA